jgi:hypothetical protein
MNFIIDLNILKSFRIESNKVLLPVFYIFLDKYTNNS